MPSNTAPLNVIVMESERHAADEAVRELTEAGHVVLRCHDAGAATFPCRGLENRSDCPLHSHAVDVALTVRSRPRSQPTATEDGVRCALMARLPVVVAGPAVLDPFERYGARVIDRTYDVVDACADVARGESVEHSRVATEALRAARVPNEILHAARTTVTRRRGGLLASITGLGGLAPRQRDAAIVRMMGKLREFDSSARVIDVVDVGSQSSSAAVRSGIRHST
jgi:hypothetical protein